jgi:hypothetical protein
MNTKNFPNLVQFLGGYFHQDFIDDYGTPDNAIKAFLSENSPETVQAVCRELDEVIPLVEQMDNPNDFLYRVIGCFYYPQADGFTVVEWLRHVRQQLGCK